MEIIQTFTWEESEVYVISDGTSLHLVDEGDIESESLSVGSSIRSSDIGDKYMEIPISVLEEMARRAQVVVEPDPEDSSNEDESDVEEVPGPPDWKPLAIEKFLSEQAALLEGERCTVSVEVRVYDIGDDNFDPDSEVSGHGWSAAIGSIAEQNAGYLAARESVSNRTRLLDTEIQEFVREQNDLGHRDLEKKDVYTVLTDALENAEGDQSEAA